MAKAAKQPGIPHGRPPRADDDGKLWAWATRGTKPLADRAKAEPARPEKSRQAEIPHAPRPRRAAVASSALTLSAKDTAGIDRRTADRFLRGEMAIDSKLDLHGMTQSEAHDALDRFLDRAIARGDRCVIVVTGKGRGGGESGVLRASVPRWLNQIRHRQQILSFSPARPRHGGDGAIYVLLRRQRDRGGSSRS